MVSNTAVSNIVLRCLKSRARGCVRVYMKRASVRNDKTKRKGKTGNDRRERKNEEKKEKGKRQGCPGETMLTTWASTGGRHHDDDDHTQAFIAFT